MKRTPPSVPPQSLGPQGRRSSAVQIRVRAGCQATLALGVGEGFALR